jgi:hypothetical protein
MMQTIQKLFWGAEWILLLAGLINIFMPNIPFLAALPLYLGMFYLAAIPVWSMTAQYKALPIFLGLLSGICLCYLLMGINFQTAHWQYAKEIAIGMIPIVSPIMAITAIIALIAKEKAGSVWHHSKWRWLITGAVFVYVAHAPLFEFWQSIIKK